MFKASTYRERRSRLQNFVGSGVILFLGNEESAMNYADNTFPFRQDSSFLYYFGLDELSLAAVIDCESGEEILFGNDKTIDEIVWMGYQPLMRDKADQVGVARILPLKELNTFIKEVKNRKRPLHFLPPYRPETALKLFNLLGLLPEELEQKASVVLIKAIVEQRSIKTEKEIVEIEKAVNVSVEMQLKSMRLARELKPGSVLTSEPGIYFIPQLIDLWKKENHLGSFINFAKVEEYRDFGGRRSEEDFLISETGYRRLGIPLAKTIETIEQIHGEALS